jgi:CRP-like cAMP-binding protein
MALNLELLKQLPLASYEAGQNVIVEGAKVRSLYFLESGSVVVLKGETEVAVESTVGAVFGEMSVLLETVTTATVRTREPATFRIAAQPREFLAANPAVLLHVSELLARRLEAVTRYLVDVKQQFEAAEGHLGMVDGVLETLLNRQPRKVPRIANRGD